MHIQDIIPSAQFIRNANGKAVWEVATMAQANRAISELGATAYNWCPVQQAKPANARKPQVAIAY